MENKPELKQKEDELLKMTRSYERRTINYTLPTQVSGKNLIQTIQQVAGHFDYKTEVKPLNRTINSIESMIIFSRDFKYDGVWSRYTNENVKSVKIFDEQRRDEGVWEDFLNINRLLTGKKDDGLVFTITLWTAEAFLDENENYKTLPIHIFKGNGLGYTDRAKPLNPSSRHMLEIKPAVDGLVGRVKDYLAQSK